MSVISRPLLCAFAGGCLSNALLFGLWRAAEPAAASSATHPHRSHEDVVELATTSSAATRVERAREVAGTDAPEPAHATAGEPIAAQGAPDVDTAAPTPAGSAVSDVLTRLEAAYRERASAQAPAQAPPPEPVPATQPTQEALAAREPARAAPPQPVAEAAPVVAARPATAIEPPAAALPAAAPAAVLPQVPAPAIAAEDTARPTEVHYGDINQNTYITNVREGDVYMMQMQQLAILQYVQLLGASSGLAAPPRRMGGGHAQRAPLTSGITNPDNPWGFKFAPPNLVR